MASSKITPEHHCCGIEKKQLMAELRECDMCATSYEQWHQCYRQKSKESGRRARACMFS